MAQREFTYPASIEKQADHAWLVRFRDLPEALTDGATFDEALDQAADALDEAIAGRIRREDVIPAASTKRAAEHLVAVPALMAAKAALYLAVKESGIGKRDLARRLGLDEKESRRLLDPRHPTKIQRLQEALESAGGTLVVTLGVRPTLKRNAPSPRATQPRAARASTVARRRAAAASRRRR